MFPTFVQVAQMPETKPLFPFEKYAPMIDTRMGKTTD
jgi:hypothetical protein